ncbi:hypothetical protein Pint_11439 [Pistacia integerrima]|uniref:Uncharacterized protein n=1 Tax=Pistacia integerrima TaxID=434235 RepID=A0ACC0XEF3_9ROSI|nr:hypothetical protein Pint_11439 [Pistacia integerrima]
MALMWTSISAIQNPSFINFKNINDRRFFRAITRASGSSSTVSDGSSVLLRAAKHTVDTYIKSGMVVGLGSGQASGMAIQYLGQQLRAGALKDIVGIPMSITSATEAATSGIPLDQYQDTSQVCTDSNHLLYFLLIGIDFAFDDADIIEEGTLVAVIGRQRPRGDESIIEEKSILNAADKLVFIVPENRFKGGLEGSIPVQVQSLNWMDAAEEIDDMFLGDAEVWRRPYIGHAGPLGGDFPLITKEGHNVLDVIFTSPIQSLAEVAESLDKVEGVVDHGIVSKSPLVSSSPLYSL